MTAVLTLRFNPLTGGFDNHLLAEFTKDKNLIEIRDHFFHHDGHPYLALVITYRPGELLVPDESSSAPRIARRDTDWRELLSDKALPIFNSLRQWRSARAKADGMQPYLISTNRHFAIMAESRPQSLEALQKIEGFGQSRAEKYGREILDILSSTLLFCEWGLVYGRSPCAAGSKSRSIVPCRHWPAKTQCRTARGSRLQGRRSPSCGGGFRLLAVDRILEGGEDER